MVAIVRTFLFAKYMELVYDGIDVYSGRDDFYGGCMSVFNGGVIKRKLVLREPNERYEDFMDRVHMISEAMVYDAEQSGFDYYEVYEQHNPIYIPEDNRRYLNSIVVTILETARRLKINDAEFYIYHNLITDAEGYEVDVDEVMNQINTLKRHLPS